MSSDTKYFFPLFSKALWSRINSYYHILFPNLKKNTLLVELLVVTWVPSILRHHIYIYIYIYMCVCVCVVIECWIAVIEHLSKLINSAWWLLIPHSCDHQTKYWSDDHVVRNWVTKFYWFCLCYLNFVYGPTLLALLVNFVCCHNHQMVSNNSCLLIVIIHEAG